MSSFLLFLSSSPPKPIGIILYYSICTVLRCGLPPLRPHCGGRPRRRAEIRTTPPFMSYLRCHIHTRKPIVLLHSSADVDARFKLVTTASAAGLGIRSFAHRSFAHRSLAHSLISLKSNEPL